mgnify:FL=1
MAGATVIAMRSRVLAAALLAVVLPFAASACSHDSGPSGSDLSVYLQKTGLSKGVADCADKAGQKAGLTDKQVRDAVKGNVSGLTAKKARTYARTFGDCLGASGPPQGASTTTP